MIGIYKIQNKVNGKIYIGQSVNIENRWKQHIRELNKESHANQHLLSSWKKYGQENFEFSVICTCNSYELDEKEIYYIDLYKTYNYEYGYNMTIGGTGAKRYYDTDLIMNTYKSTNSVAKTSEILKIHEFKISEILSELNIREIKSPHRKIVGISSTDYSIQYEFDSIKEAYDYFDSTVTNQINKSIKDSKYTAFDCIWFDRDDYILHKDNLDELLSITKYKTTTKYDDSKEDDLTHNHKTKVICTTTGEIFDSVLDGARHYGIKSENGICYCCSYKRNTCGGLSWMYLDEYEYMIYNNLTVEDMKKRYVPKNVTKKVMCLDTKRVFNSIVEANKYAGIGIYSGKISTACQNKKYRVGKDKNGNPLHWMYYEECVGLSDEEISDLIKKIDKNSLQNGNKFVCLETKKLFDSIDEVLKYASLKSSSGVYDCCNNKKKHAGNHPITGEKLSWMYYKDYIEKFDKSTLLLFGRLSA